MKHGFRIFLYISITVIFVGAIVIIAGAFLIFSPPHIPSLNEIRFRWKLTGRLDSPAQIRQLTTFPWERVCIKDDFDWLERPDKGNYILIFYHESKPVDEFYLDKNKHSNLELHAGHCFGADQKIFHKIEDYSNSQHTPSEIFFIRMEQAKEQKKQPNLQDLTSFDWQKACFIPPYMIKADIQKLVGQEYKIGAIDTNDDGLYNVLFLLPNKTTLAIQVPRVFYQLNARPCLTYEESKAVQLYY